MKITSTQALTIYAISDHIRKSEANSTDVESALMNMFEVLDIQEKWLKIQPIALEEFKKTNAALFEEKPQATEEEIHLLNYEIGVKFDNFCQNHKPTAKFLSETFEKEILKFAIKGLIESGISKGQEYLELCKLDLVLKPVKE